MTTQEPNYYKILGLDPMASEQQVERAYRGLLEKHNPDTMPPYLHSKAAEQCKLLDEAYSVLMDSAKRKAYDNRHGKDMVKKRESSVEWVHTPFTFTRTMIAIVLGLATCRTWWYVLLWGYRFVPSQISFLVVVIGYPLYWFIYSSSRRRIIHTIFTLVVVGALLNSWDLFNLPRFWKGFKSAQQKPSVHLLQQLSFWDYLPRREKVVVEGIAYDGEHSSVFVGGEEYFLNDTFGPGRITAMSPNNITITTGKRDVIYEVGEEVKVK